ncbi:fimbrial outer membrane usher protein StiC [Raoultella planticola]|uniref:Fimbrial outer membrane usher protein StiC n=1 Tax=Raoultella planticola TaxID=575 RepID=A0A485BZP4_RAOPL|nr:fimbrial outer membrane usher protein StiC [Raoultella planticola]
MVLANYQTHIGNRVLFTLRNRDGAVPFGASVQLRQQEDDTGAAPQGMVADGGQAYLSGIPQEACLR